MSDEISAARGALIAIAPFIGSLLLKCRVVYENIDAPAANDGDRTLFINQQLFNELKPKDRLFVLAHETLHLALLSKQRQGDRDHYLWNLATDCVINYILIKSGLDTGLSPSIVTPQTISRITGVSELDIVTMTAEQIYNLIAKSSFVLNPHIGMCSNDKYAKPSNSNGEGTNETENFWKAAIAEAYNYSKSIGHDPAGIDVFFKLLKPKINWRTLLRQAIVHGNGLQIISTWKKVHRKVPGDVPGHIRLTVSNIWTLVDTSGSMVGEHLDQVMTEVFSISRSLHARVRLVAWDTEPYEMNLDEVKREIEKKRGKVKGGGGTEISPALDFLLKKMRNNDGVVILSDGFISDEYTCQPRLERISVKSSTAVFVTTVKPIPLPEKWRLVPIS
jgi:predicted metal-dependent peptidase